jgi:hypothetical protein
MPPIQQSAAILQAPKWSDQTGPQRAYQNAQKEHKFAVFI